MVHGEVWSTPTPRGLADGLISNTGGWQHSDPDPSLNIWDAINTPSNLTPYVGDWKDEYIYVDMSSDEEVIEFSIADIPAPMEQPGAHHGPRLHTLELRSSSSDGGDDGSTLDCALYQGSTLIDRMGDGGVPTYPSNSNLRLYLDHEVDTSSTTPHGGSFPTADPTSGNYEDLRIRLTAKDPDYMGVSLYVFWTHFDCYDDTSDSQLTPVVVAVNTSGPTVVIGGDTVVEPAAVTLAVNTSGPAVELGDITLTSLAVSLAVNSSGPAVVLGDIALTPQLSLAVNTSAVSYTHLTLPTIYSV